MSNEEESITLEDVVVQNAEPERIDLFNDFEKRKRSIRRDIVHHNIFQIHELIIGETLLSSFGSILLMIYSFLSYYPFLSLAWNVIKLAFSLTAISAKNSENKEKHLKFQRMYLYIAVCSLLILGLYIYTLSLVNINECRFDDCDRRFMFMISIVGPIQIVMVIVESALYQLLYKKSRLYVDLLQELERLFRSQELQNLQIGDNANAPQQNPNNDQNRLMSPANEYRHVSRLLLTNKLFALLWIQVSYASVQLVNTIIMLIFSAKRYALFCSLIWSIFKLAILGYLLFKFQDKSLNGEFALKTLKRIWVMAIIMFFVIVSGYNDIFLDYPDCVENRCLGLQGYIEILAANLIAVIISIDVFYIYQVICTAKKYFILSREKDIIFSALPYTTENVEIISPPITEAMNRVRTFSRFYALVHSKILFFCGFHAVLSVSCIICYFPAPFPIVSLAWNFIKSAHFLRLKLLINKKTLEATKKMIQQIILMIIVSFLMIIAIFVDLSNEKLSPPGSWLNFISSPLLYITLGIHSCEISVISFSLLCGKSLFGVISERDGFSSGQGRA